MAKPTPYWVSLNQPPRSAKHGKHRRAGAPAYGSPIIGTDYGSGGSDQGITIITGWNTIWTVNDAANDAIESFSFREPDPPTIDYAGIRTGELIGHRLWWVMPEGLSSLVHRRIWQPGETVKGNTNAIVNDGAIMRIMHPIWGGTYSFFQAHDLGRDVRACKIELEDAAARRRVGLLGGMFQWEGSDEALGIATGTIKMWGDVVEHERGYRAEFAKINSIDWAFGAVDLAALRTRYGVARFPLTQNQRDP